MDAVAADLDSDFPFSDLNLHFGNSDATGAELSSVNKCQTWIKFSSYQSSNFSIDEHGYAIVFYDVEASIDL